MLLFKFQNFLFDDYVADEDENSDEYGKTWSPICEYHTKYFDEKFLDKNIGLGFCGIRGCNQEAVHHIIFQKRIED